MKHGGARKRMKTRVVARKRAAKKSPTKAVVKKTLKQSANKKAVKKIAARPTGAQKPLKTVRGSTAGGVVKKTPFRKAAKTKVARARPNVGGSAGTLVSGRARSRGAGPAGAPRVATGRSSATKAFSFAEGLGSIVDAAPSLGDHLEALSRNVMVTVTVPTEGGVAVQAFKGDITLENFRTFAPRGDARDVAAERLTALGLKVVRRNRFSLTVSGPAALIAEVTGAPLVAQVRQRDFPLRATRRFSEDLSPPGPMDLFLAPAQSLTVASRVGGDVDHFVFMPPPINFAPAPHPSAALPSAIAPAMMFPGLDAAIVRRRLNVPAGARGAGVRVAMVDTGFYPHPYYSANGLRFTPTATASAPHPERDAEGHGTAVAWNVFAVAPDVELMGFQHAQGAYQDALEEASDAGADIISCSWGWNYEQVFNPLQLSLLSVIADGKIVIFSAGNGHYAWPASQPEVLSIGGVHVDAGGGLEASDYASGFMSSRFPNRRVPDVCGLCGQQPKAIYFMMPTQPGSAIDQANAGPMFPDGDGTRGDDGWAGASGTSSAAPQIAGVAALMMERARQRGVVLTTSRVRDLLERTAVGVNAGANAMRFPARGQPNTATGWGLVDAAAAIALV